MHDALARYEADTEIVDVDEWHAPPSLPRVPTGELTMQVYVDGAYHRRTPDLATTACGVPYHSEFSKPRREELTHPLSRDCGCFTPFELTRADAAKRELEEGTR
jgi:hypothetical protein